MPSIGSTGKMPSPAALRALFFSYLAVSNQHDVVKMRKFYADPIYINGIPRAPAAVSDQFLPLWAGFPDWTWDALHITVEGEYLALHFNQSGTHTGTFMGIEPTGRHVESPEFSLYHMVNGKFTEIWDLNNRNRDILAVISA
jgi:aspartyl-tRNA synthetase